MSDIEEIVIPVLQPMVTGKHPSQLRKHDQYALALWMSLRSIIFDLYSATDHNQEYFTHAGG